MKNSEGAVYSPNANDALSDTARTELKGLVFVGMEEAGSEGLTLTGVDKTIGAHLQLEDRLQLGGYALSFLKAGYADVEVRESEYNRRMVKYYSTKNEEPAMAYVGALLDWSRRTEVPLELMLGQASSAAKDSSNAPSNSIEILRAARDGVIVGEVDHTGYSNQRFDNSRLVNMKNNGVIEDVHDTFEILDPVHSKKRGNTLSPPSAHMYRAFGAAESLAPEREWTFPEFYDFALTLCTGEELEDKAFKNRLKVCIRAAIVEKRDKEFRGATTQVASYRSRLSVSPDYEEHVGSLLELVDKLVAGEPGFMSESTDMAHDIYRDVPVAHKLAVRSIAASPFYDIPRKPKKLAQ